MKRYLIIGGTGSLGKKLITRLSKDDVAIYSRDELKQWTLKNDILAHSKDAQLPKSLKFFVGDVRDSSRIKDVVSQFKPSDIIIAAALKQVDTCELSPYESVQTNLLGTQNVINVVNSSTGDHVKRVLFVSTDKACASVNTYGMCKAISERLIQSQSSNSSSSVTWLCTRYGNVLESRGSIIPLFKFQAEQCDHLTVTDPEMTRFVMTLNESVDLILSALNNASSGQTWVPQLPSMKIGDLAELFSETYDKPYKVVGIRPGEKKHEDLINESESYRTDVVKADGKSFYVIGPSYSAGSNIPFKYSSADNVMTKDQLKKRLCDLKIFDMSIEQFVGQRVEEIQSKKATK